MIVVELTESEAMQAALVAVQRQVQNLFAGRRDANHAPQTTGWDFHIQGAAGEMAFAKWCGEYWSGSLGDLNAADVGARQVRTTSYPYGHLLLKGRDKPDDVFVLVTGRIPTFTLVGWIFGRDGMISRLHQDRADNGRPCWWVPQSMLQKFA